MWSERIKIKVCHRRVFGSLLICCFRLSICLPFGQHIPTMVEERRYELSLENWEWK